MADDTYINTDQDRPWL